MSGGLARRFTSFANNPTGLQLLAQSDLNSGAAATISATFPTRNYLKIVLLVIGKTGADTTKVIFNADAAASYAHRFSLNGAADTTAVAQNSALAGPISGTVGQLITMELFNVGGLDKHISFVNVGERTTPAAAPSRAEGAIFWDNETVPITTVTFSCTGANNLAQFTTLLVFGADT